MTAHHFIRAHFGPSDPVPLQPATPAADHVTHVNLVSGHSSLGFGIGTAIIDAAKLRLAPTEIGFDLLILAALVYAADTRIRRPTFSQDSWTREIGLEIPVSDPAVWTANAPLINRMLRFLSGDIWQVVFRPRPPRFGRLVSSRAVSSRARKPSRFDSICLFSGGLDSLVGAIEIIGDGRNPLLVSHAAEGATSDAQNKLLAGLQKKRADLTRLRFWIGFPRNLIDHSGRVEESTRARSFLFFAAAAFAASSFFDNSITIVVPENGLISLNVPLDPLRLGSLSTRTTHPFYMARWNELLRHLTIPAHLENLYQFRTKGEMLAACTDQELLRKVLSQSMSCSSPTKGRWSGRPIEHCGYCVPCLIRRAAIRAAIGADPTPYTLADLHAGMLNSEGSEGRQIRSFQFAVERLHERPEIATTLIHKPGPLTDWISNLTDLADVYRRGMAEVRALVHSVNATPT